MIQPTFFTLLAVTVFYGCSDRTTIQKDTAQFNTFEISYSNGWFSHFSFIADTNNIYFFTGSTDTTYYGILSPETIHLLNTTASKVKQNTIQSNDLACLDCQALAVKIVTNGDTIQIHQFGELDTLFTPVIAALQKLLHEGKHQHIPAFLLPETKSIIVPPPPLKVDTIKFKDLEEM
jgi:hypothetical protein